MARGRPPRLDKEQGLAQALETFWSHGYSGASYSELSAALGVTKPSLYNAFGNKEETFLKALNLYLDRIIKPSLIQFDADPAPRHALETLLIGIAKGMTDPSTPRGCMIAVNVGATRAPDVPKEVAEALLTAVKLTPNAIERKLKTAAHLPPNTTPTSLARYFEAVMSGMATQAMLGESQETLVAIAQHSLAFWPKEGDMDEVT